MTTLLFISYIFLIDLSYCRLPQQQINALQDIYHGLNGPHWNFCSWNFTFLSTANQLPQKYCGLLIRNYSYIVYNDSIIDYQTVWGLKFSSTNNSGYNISGYLHPDISMLTDLKVIFFESELLGGTIPSSICNLTLLYFLNFENTMVTGPIPQCIGYLPSLQIVQLFRNSPNLTFDDNILKLWCNNSIRLELIVLEIDYYGSIPDCIGDKLTHLHWFNFHPTTNNFNGTLPSSFNNLTQLQLLQLNSPNLFGTISSLILQNNPGLEGIYIENTSLSVADDELDAFVNSLCSLSNLTSIQITSNPLLSLYIPKCIESLNQLIAISFGFLSKQIPWKSLCNLSNLFQFDIRNSTIQQNEIDP